MKTWKYIAGLIGLLLVVIFAALLSFPERKLHLIACDVGQGDAILVTYGTTQILIDGGPNNQVLNCLSSHTPFWDREIELVVLTHPEADHYTGLIEVFRRYKVDNYLANSFEVGGGDYQVLKKEVGGSRARILNPSSGMKLGIGPIRLDIVWPLVTDIRVLGTSVPKGSLNKYSVVMNLVMGEFDALLTGDISPDSGEILVMGGEIKNVEYIKIPHHGSKNGLTKSLLEVTMPKLAVISVGKNQWGHPHQEILDMLKEKNIRTLRTDLNGDIEVITDGKTWWVKK